MLAGEVHSVARRGRQLYRAAWHHRVPQRASLVVAAIEGGPDQQTWENFARALDAASHAVGEDGSVVLCTDLQCRPGPALQRLAGGDDEATLWRLLQRERSPDAIAAVLLAQVLQRTKVYLVSGLDSDTVEELGLGYIADEEQLRRLAREHDSWVLLGSAERAALEAGEPDGAEG